MTYPCINGWTKARMVAQLRARNTGRRCVSPLAKGDECLYELGTNHCAVGCFIPDGHAAMQLSGNAWALFREHPSLLSAMPLSEPGMEALQRVHDHNHGRVRRKLLNWVRDNVVDSPDVR